MSSNREGSRDFSHCLQKFSLNGASDFFSNVKCPDDEIDLEEHRVFRSCLTLDSVICLPLL